MLVDVEGIGDVGMQCGTGKMQHQENNPFPSTKSDF